MVNGEWYCNIYDSYGFNNYPPVCVVYGTYYVGWGTFTIMTTREGGLCSTGSECDYVIQCFVFVHQNYLNTV